MRTLVICGIVMVIEIVFVAVCATPTIPIVFRTPSLSFVMVCDSMTQMRNGPRILGSCLLFPIWRGAICC